MKITINGEKNSLTLEDKNYTVEDILNMDAVRIMLGFDTAEDVKSRFVGLNRVSCVGDADLRKVLFKVVVEDGSNIVISVPAVDAGDDDEEADHDDNEGDEEEEEDEPSEEELTEDAVNEAEQQAAEIRARVNAVMENLPGVVRVEVAGGCIGFTVNIVQGQTKVKDVVYGAKVRNRTGLTKDQLDKCAILVNNVPVQLEVPLRDNDFLKLTTVVANKTSSY